MADSATNDSYKFYFSEPITVDPLLNDDVPAGSSIVLSSSFSSGFDVSVNADGRTLTIDGRSFTGNSSAQFAFLVYNVRGPDGEFLGETTTFGGGLTQTEFVEGRISLEGIPGIPGIGRNLMEIGQVTEDTGVQTIKLGPLVDFTNSQKTVVKSAVGTVDGFVDAGPDRALNQTVNFTFSEDEIRVDTSQFGYLEEGEVKSFFLDAEVENNDGTFAITYQLVVTGTADTDMMISTASGGRMTGGTGNDQLTDVANALTILDGGAGRDEVIFGSDYADSTPSLDVITGFDAGVDAVTFNQLTLITGVSQIQDGIMLVTAGGDVLTIYGDGLDTSELTLSNFRDISGLSQQEIIDLAENDLEFYTAAATVFPFL